MNVLGFLRLSWISVGKKSAARIGFVDLYNPLRRLIANKDKLLLVGPDVPIDLYFNIGILNTKNILTQSRFVLRQSSQGRSSSFLSS